MTDIAIPDTTPVSDTERGSRWLAHVATAGAAPARLSTALRIVRTISEIAQWYGAALVARAVMTDTSLIAGLIVVAVGGIFTPILRALADRADADAFRLIAARAREDILDSQLGKTVGHTAPSVVADSALELVDDVASHLSASTPLAKSAPISMLLIAIAVAIAHWPLAIVLIAATLILPINMWLSGMLAKDGNDRYLSALHQLSAVVLDSFRGLGTLIRFGSTERRAGTIKAASERLRDANIAVLKRAFMSTAVMDAIVTLSIAVCATYIGFDLLEYIRVPGTDLDLGAGLFVLMLTPMYFRPVQEASGGFHAKERAVANAVPLSAMAEHAEQMREATDVVLHSAEQNKPASSAPTVRIGSGVVLASDGTPIVRLGAELTAAPQTWTVLTGPSGGGKTTLLSALAGLRDSADVTWEFSDGGRKPWMGGASWIGQKTLILPESLRENARLGSPSATDGDIAEALDAVGLTPLMDSLPDGLDTVCGYGGYQLSAGEQRRVAIARAILRGSKLWMLDEPTAHLDRDSEALVVDALIAATMGCTVLCVTHSAHLAALGAARWHVTDGEVSVR